VSERQARHQAEAQASAAQILVAHLKLLIAKLRRERYGQSSERGRKMLDQLELDGRSSPGTGKLMAIPGPRNAGTQ
jgi:hypothetical protein